MKKFWNMKVNASTGEGELYLYGDISSVSWWGDEITPQTFKEDLDALGDISVLNVFINSNGGDVFAGQAIHSMLKRCKAKVVVTVDGLAASIASVICMAGDVVRMGRNTCMMVHRPWTYAVGNSADMRKMADDLDIIGESLVAAYQDKTGLSAEEIRSIMDNETWLTADECKEKGFCDEVIAEKKVAACLRGNILAMNGQEFDVSKYRNRPNVEMVVELPTPAPMVGEEETAIADKRVAEAVNRIMNETTLSRHDAITVATVAIAVYDSGRVLSAENEDHIRSAHDALGKVLDKLAKEDSTDDEMMDPEDPDHDPMHEPDEDDDDKAKGAALTEVLAELKSLREEVVSMKAAFSNAPAAMQNVDPVAEVKPSSVEDEVVIVDEPEHVLVLDDASNEVDIEADTLKQAVKEALAETRAELQAERSEWRLRNLGKVD